MEYILENQSILLLSGLLALIFVFVKDKWVSNQEVGNEKMARIAKNISDGAMSGRAPLRRSPPGDVA